MGKSDSERLEELQDAIADVLFVITDVAMGDYSGQLQVPQGEDTARSALYQGVNQMIEALKETRDKHARAVAELEEKVQIISRQAAAIRELSTPVLEVWDEVLVMPVIGFIDASRSSDLIDTALREVAAKRARHLILDITGVEVVDTATADHIVRVVDSTRLIGAECVITGIRPAVAQTLVALGADLSTLTAFNNLEEGLKACLVSKGMGPSRAR